MKRLAFFVLITMALVQGGCTSIDVVLNKKVDVVKKMKKIAVFPFDIKGAGWGDEFSDAISHQFFKSGKVDIVEREAIERILKEQRLSMSGLIEDTQAVRIGKMLGADVIILGRGSSLRLTDEKRGRDINNLVDTFSLKAISVEAGDLLFTVRKEPGPAWDTGYKLMYCCSGTIIWGRQDILIKSSRYDDISKQVVKKILLAFNQIEQEKQLK
ncbi:MAG TPA: curli assembly protein CsgG [Spirochaetes bacterium]|nr:curli assembly protein CsgG [Spirochaetota bacterium]